MYSALLLLFSFFRTCFHARSILSLLLPWMAFGDTAAITRNRSSATRCWLSVEIRACIIIYCELKSAEAIGSGGPSPTFWPLWAAPIFGPPTFDSRGPRQSVKDTHNYSFTSWIPGKTWKNPTRWLLWHSNITKFNFGPGPPKRSLRRSLRPPIVGWGGGYSLHIPHLHDLWRRWSAQKALSVTGPPTFQMLPPPMSPKKLIKYMPVFISLPRRLAIFVCYILSLIKFSSSRVSQCSKLVLTLL